MLTNSPKVTVQMLSAGHSGSDLIQGGRDAPRHDDPLTTFDPGQVTRIVTNMHPQGARVPGVGCGTGALAQVLSDASGAEFQGIAPDDLLTDPDLSMLWLAGISEVGLFNIVGRCAFACFVECFSMVRAA